MNKNKKLYRQKDIPAQRGISIYLTLIVMSVIISIGLEVSIIFLQQAKILKIMGDSVIAFYAANTGIERVLREGTTTAATLSNGATYNAVWIPKGGPGCGSAVAYCVQSVGVYKETRRAIQITR